MTQRFSKDTAYVLVYKKLHDSELRAGRIDMNETIASVNIDPPLRRDLRESVEKDNILFLQVTTSSFVKTYDCLSQDLLCGESMLLLTCAIMHHTFSTV